MTKQVYNAGCALRFYKPELAEKVLSYLDGELGEVEPHTVCCKHEPKLPAGTQIINTCAGCNKRFSSLYDGITTITLWEVLAQSTTFPFPDYQGATMTLHDPCPIRTVDCVHEVVRFLLKRMNIHVVETAKNRSNSVCCGDSFYPALPVEEVNEKMRERAQSMPCDEVCVYCISCIKSMHIGGKKPRYLLDLLFNQSTQSGVYDTAEWHSLLQEFIDRH